MNKFPKIETERLLLTELSVDDISEIVHQASNKNISDFTQNIPFPYCEKDAIFWINAANQGFQNGSQYTFAIRKKGKNRFMGGIGIKVDKTHNRAEIGYWLGESFWGKGFITEASKSIIKFGFESLHLNKFTSSHLAKNPASGRVLENCGMVKEGELKMHLFKHSEYQNLILYGLTREEYEKKQSTTAYENNA